MLTTAQTVESLLEYQQACSDSFDKPVLLKLTLVQKNGWVRNVEDEVVLWMVEELSHERISRVSEKSNNTSQSMSFARPHNFPT